MKKHKTILLNQVLLGVSLIFSSNLMAATIIDWRTNSPGSGSVGSVGYTTTAGGLTVTASAYVAELSGGNSQIFGPFFTSTNPTQFGFVRNSAGLGLQIDSNSTLDPISGTERCCGLIQPGFNSDPYLTGNTSVEAMNFALFQFDAPVNLNSLTVDDVSNFSRGSWVDYGSTAPGFGSGIENALSGFAIINAPDTEASDGEFTTFFNVPNSFTYLLIGAPPTANVAGITGPSREGFYIQSFDVTAVPLPLAVWLFGSGLLGLFGISRRKEA